MPLARWAFNTRQQLLLENVEPLVTSLTDDANGRRIIVPVSNLLNYLPKSDTDGLLQFRLEDDMRRALIGRLMIYAFFTAHHNCQWGELVFDNSENTKPILLLPEDLKNVSFNVSHHGDWVILVGDTEASSDSPVLLGVDVMDFQEQAPGESFKPFSSCFQDQFTPKEITFLEAATESSEPCAESQLRRLYRLWCLKESMINALNTRSHFDLKTIEFIIQDEEETEMPILSTAIAVHDPKPELLPEEGWSFEEALLDSDHCYAIAVQSGTERSILDGSEIRRFDWKELLKDAVPYPIQS